MKTAKLIWKTQSNRLDIASNRYRCLFPIEYLNQIKYHSLIYSGKELIHFNSKPDAIIFVKSFTPHDLNLARTASQLGIPIILDLCDNILVDEYGFKSKIKPQEFFLEMSRLAALIVTTGEALKSYLEKHPQISTPIVIIADGNETIQDFQSYNLIIKNNIYRKITLSFSDINFIAAQAKELSKKALLETQKMAQKTRKTAIKKAKVSIDKLKSAVKKSKIEIKKFYFRSDSLPEALVYKSSSHNIKHEDCQTQAEIAIAPGGAKSLVLELESQAEKNDIGVDASASYRNLKQIIWFGNHGVKPGIGMLALLNIKDELVEVSQKVDFCLHVVSDNYEKYCEYIKPLPFPTRYTPWDFFGSRECISQSAITIIPTSLDTFNACKSANRAVLSLSLGVPVVATEIPSLIPLRDCLILDDWKNGIISYLTDRRLVTKHINKAQEIIAQNYSGAAIARQWAEAIEQVIQGKV